MEEVKNEEVEVLDFEKDIISVTEDDSIEMIDVSVDDVTPALEEVSEETIEE